MDTTSAKLAKFSFDIHSILFGINPKNYELQKQMLKGGEVAISGAGISIREFGI
jgi:hypothetical protein